MVKAENNRKKQKQSCRNAVLQREKRPFGNAYVLPRTWGIYKHRAMVWYLIFHVCGGLWLYSSIGLEKADKNSFICREGGCMAPR